VAKTYLQLVNKVLVNLREATVGDMTAAYTQLLGEFVNQAKETVEDSWRWRILTSEVQVTTVAQQIQYYLDAAANSPAVTLVSGNYPDERAQLLKDDEDHYQAFDITGASSNVVYQLSHTAREDQVLSGYLAPARSQNIPYAFSYTMEGGRPSIYLVDPPPVGRVLAFRFCAPQTEFGVGTETLLVPWRPVVSMATALAMQERGEELGESADLYFSRYNSELLRAQENDRDGSYDQLLVDTQNE
jgi:hypothetical protein